MDKHAESGITHEQFNAYERVRASGATNMWDTATVAALSGGQLDRADVLAIISNYDALDALWPEVRHS